MSSSSGNTRVIDWVSNSVHHASHQVQDEGVDPGVLLKEKLMRLMKRVISRDLGKNIYINIE